MNYVTIQFLNGQLDNFNFTVDTPIETNEQLLAVANELCDRTKSKKCTVAVWEDSSHTFIKKCLLINQKSGFSLVQHEYFAALALQQTNSERFEFLLKQIPDYDDQDEAKMEAAILAEEKVDKQIGYSRSLEYLKEVEDRLLEESHAEMKKLPGYKAKSANIDLLFERAKSDVMVRRKVVEIAARTKN